MSCFMVPVTGAVVSKLVSKHCEKKGKVSVARKISWLTKLLSGGSLLLAFEHIWHGEIVFYPPFLTAMDNVADESVAIHEMATIGVAMFVACLTVWCGMIVVCAMFERQTAKDAQ